MKRIIIIGSRRRTEAQDFFACYTALMRIYEDGDILISGGCSKGGDKFAEYLSAMFEIPIVIFSANWSRYGRGAGFVRNTYIAQNGDKLIACVAPDRKGGTEDTIKKFKKFMPEGEIILLH